MKLGNPDDPRTIARTIMTTKEYEAWEAVEMNGWSHRRLAHALNITPSAVRDRLTSAKKKQLDYVRLELALAEPRHVRQETTPTRMILNLLAQRDGTRCYLCRRTFNRSQLVVEHIIATSRGGTDDAENLALSCHSCNGTKGTKYVSLLLTSERAVYHPQ